MDVGEDGGKQLFNYSLYDYVGPGKEIEYSLKEHKQRDLKDREEKKIEHKLYMEENLKKIKTLKDKLKDKLNFHSK